MQYKKPYIIGLAVIFLLGVTALSYWLWHRSRTTPEVTSIQKVCSPCAQTLLLSYGEFGPPSISYELEIGNAWNQWKNEGHELPDDVDIKVVVYRGIELEELRKQFPVIKGKSDYRYLEYARAIQFLEEKGKVVEGYLKEEQEHEDRLPSAVKMWEELDQTLKNTHRVIIENLGV